MPWAADCDECLAAERDAIAEMINFCDSRPDPTMPPIFFAHLFMEN